MTLARVLPNSPAIRQLGGWAGTLFLYLWCPGEDGGVSVIKGEDTPSRWLALPLKRLDGFTSQNVMLMQSVRHAQDALTHLFSLLGPHCFRASWAMESFASEVHRLLQMTANGVFSLCVCVNVQTKKRKLLSSNGLLRPFRRSDDCFVSCVF